MGSLADVDNHRKVFASTTIPEELSLGFAIPLTFIAIVAPAIRTQPDLLACGTSGGIALAGQALPWNSGLLIAALGGVIAGWMAHRFKQPRWRDDLDHHDCHWPAHICHAICHAVSRCATRVANCVRGGA